MSNFQIQRDYPSLAQFNIKNLSNSDINWAVKGTVGIESGFATTNLAFSDEFESST
ncbi:MAG: hypothetical protein ACRD8W_03600 [Nitrososphaeraceae archaeon]